MVSNWTRDTGLLWAGCHWKAIQENFTLSWLRPATAVWEGLVLHLRFAETPAYAEVEVIDRETF